MARKSKPPGTSPAPTTKKGRVLERLVADLYTLPDVTVETNVRLPVPDAPGRVREIDVLVSGSLAGHVIRIPIECKNYRRRIGVEEIDAFAGKLADLRLPGPGVYVSTIGFTKGALDRATKANVHPLVLSGLSPGRLASAVVDVIKSTVYLLLRITKISVQNSLPDVKEVGALHVFYDGTDQIAGCTTDLVWLDWLHGRIPDSLGTHKYDVKIPGAWHQQIDGVLCRPHKISIEYAVVALVVDLQGTGARHGLHDPRTRLPEKLRAQWSFATTEGATPVFAFPTEELLDAHLRSRRAAVRITTGRIRLPRIQSGPAYWPPSERVVATIAGVHEAFLAGVGPDPEDLSRFDLEGPLLNTIFEPIWRAQRVMPDGRVRPPWTPPAAPAAGPSTEASTPNDGDAAGGDRSRESDTSP